MRFGRGLVLVFVTVFVIMSIFSVVGCSVSITKSFSLEDENAVAIGNIDSEVLLLPDDPPGKPDRPSGPTEGKVGKEYVYYIINPVNPNGDITYYKWDWGDGTFSDWAPYAPGEIVRSSHVWSEEGTYDVRIKAKNDFGESPWSDPLRVTITEGINIVLKNFYMNIFNNLFSFSSHINGFLR